MSLDRSLKGANALVRHRNVLTRGERLEKLAEAEKAIAGLNGTDLGGRAINVNEARPKPERGGFRPGGGGQRRGGGGGGRSRY